MSKILFYPDNLDIIKIINNDKVLTPNQRRLACKYYERVLYPINRLIMEWKYNWSYEDKPNKDLSIPLNMKILRKLYGSNEYDFFFDILLRNKIIRRVKNHSNSSNRIGQSSEYNLYPKYISEHYSRLIVTDKLLERKLNGHDLNLNNPIHKRIHDNLCKIKFPLENRNRTETYSLRCLKINEYNSMCIEKIEQKDFFINSDNKSGRLFNTIASCKKELRRKFIVDDEKLCEVDICNSQPLFFSYELNTEYKDIFDCAPQDVEFYNKIVSEGKFYEYLMHQWNIPIEERNEFKRECFASIFYCTKYTNYNHHYSKLFKKKFPNVMKHILKLKKGNYRNLSIQMQKREVGVIRNVINQIPQDMFFIPIHDSIMCKRKDCEFIKSLIFKEMNIIGLQPTIKINI